MVSVDPFKLHTFSQEKLKQKTRAEDLYIYTIKFQFCFLNDAQNMFITQ